ncbi:ABC transporter substrate-binding protein [Neomoorella thermoacetica]|uniref:ABC transporter substrate-binding protein n=1 Tax=Neomoorella thermoacetica TaxID=1525 RepID=UPI0008FB6EF3|nr:ABC transporter substrate-binding protein [Moorella thermoacetica]OIQ52750.1 leucine-, isoleucine-, valine-, threonine-, and alanine-binding protein precursor [Moorella thermoacetica]
MRKILLPIITILAILLLTGCSSSGGKEIKIGLNAELTGSIPVLGQSSKNAAMMAVEEINQAGGLEVGGTKYKVTLVVEDNEDKAESAASATQKLINQDRVLAMIGPNASRNAIPAAAVAESARVPMISPWSTNPKTTENKKYVLRACFIDDFQGVVVAKFASDKLGAKKAAVLFDVASEYNKGIAEIFKKSFEGNGGQVVAFETYTKGDKDFSAQLTKIKEANPDVLFLPNYYSEVPLQVEQARKLGYTGQIIGSDSWGNPEIIKLGGKNMEGLFFSTHYAPDIATPVAQKFIKAYQEKYKSTPDDVAALTYDAFGMLFQAIKTAGKVDRQAVRDALASITKYEGVTGTMQFKGTGDPIKSAVIIKIENGKFNYFTSINP